VLDEREGQFHTGCYATKEGLTKEWMGGSVKPRFSLDVVTKNQVTLKPKLLLSECELYACLKKNHFLSD
jgi:hypothetical protein